MIDKNDRSKFQILTLKISTSNQIPINLISFDGYTWIQKYVWKFCSYENFGHLNQSFLDVKLQACKIQDYFIGEWSTGRYTYYLIKKTLFRRPYGD